jgi:hypothetical protein
MEDRTEIIETTPTPRTTEVRSTGHPAPEVDHVDAVAYDPFQQRRMTAYRVTQLIYLVFGIIEGLIAIRFVLKALGANPNAGFAEFIYGFTHPLILPFIGLFGNPAAQGSILEINSIVALIVYALVGWLLAKLAWILLGETRSAVKTHSTVTDSHV